MRPGPSAWARGERIVANKIGKVFPNGIFPRLHMNDHRLHVFLEGIGLEFLDIPWFGRLADIFVFRGKETTEALRTTEGTEKILQSVFAVGFSGLCG